MALYLNSIYNKACASITPYVPKVISRHLNTCKRLFGASLSVFSRLPFRATQTPTNVGVGVIHTAHLARQIFGSKSIVDLTKKTCNCLSTGISALNIYMKNTKVLIGTSLLHMGRDLFSLVKNVSKAEYKKSIDDLLNFTYKTIYFLAVMKNKPLLLTTCSFAQLSHSIYLSYKNYIKGNLIESGAECLVAALHADVTYRQFQESVSFSRIGGHGLCFYLNNGSTIADRNSDYCDYTPVAIEDLAIEKKSGFIGSFSQDHPLKGLVQLLDNRTVIGYGEEEYYLPSCRRPFGKGIVKGGNLCFTKTATDKVSMQFKITHFYSEKIHEHIKRLSSCLLCQEQKNITITPPVVHEEDYEQDLFDQVYSIQSGDIVMQIGARKEIYTLYDKVTLNFPINEELESIHRALFSVGMQESLLPSTNDDQERMKIGWLFHQFQPKEAFKLERSKEFFTLDLDSLKSKIIEASPSMEKRFVGHLPKIQLCESISGKKTLCLPGLHQLSKIKGARALAAGIVDRNCWVSTDYHWSVAENKNIASEELIDCDDLISRVTSILKSGLFSQEMRYDIGLLKTGRSGMRTFYSGGADSIFTHMVVNNHVGQEWEKFRYCDNLVMLFNLQLLNRGSYQYKFDSSGMRGSFQYEDIVYDQSYYENRPSLFSFIQEEQKIAMQNRDLDSIYVGDKYLPFGYENEVMLKDGLLSNMISGIVVPYQKMKEVLLSHLREDNIIRVEGNQETIQGIPVDEFIHVGSKILPKMLAHSGK